MNYHYPIDETWSKQEIVDVVHFFSAIEKAYEKNTTTCEEIMVAYKRFKQIVPSKSEEKRIFAEFQQASGYSSYYVVKHANNQKNGVIVMKKGNS
ncbi:UPF0223 family protein [Virgibacillus oceani]|uniref:UPF0223 protein n=1 Tax=Virgibacillus oceani TaxID=1479511 RepID=A0A917M241_9BACI|nr:UPF0223 family protein [Virgibacillus oceani]GGG70133.1 UPF0223 protein [Virgibacillus oceani]